MSKMDSVLWKQKTLIVSQSPKSIKVSSNCVAMRVPVTRMREILVKGEIYAE